MSMNHPLGPYGGLGICRSGQGNLEDVAVRTSIQVPSSRFRFRVSIGSRMIAALTADLGPPHFDTTTSSLEPPWNASVETVVTRRRSGPNTRRIRSREFGHRFEAGFEAQPGTHLAEKTPCKQESSVCRAPLGDAPIQLVTLRQ